PEAEGTGALVEVEVVALGLDVEAVDEQAQQPGGAGPEDAEPEPLDVDGAGVVADPVDDRVGPGRDAEGLDVGGDVAGVHGRRLPAGGGECDGEVFRDVSVFSMYALACQAWTGTPRPRRPPPPRTSSSPGRAPGSTSPSASSCSPGRASAPTAASPTSAAPRACGPATPRRRSGPRCSTTCPTPSCGVAPGSTVSTTPPGGRSPTVGTWRWSSWSAGASSTRSSPRTSTACTSTPATTPSGSSRSTARCARWSACPAASAGPCSTRSTGCGPGRPTRPASPAAASSSRRRSASARTSTPTTSTGRPPPPAGPTS